MVRSGKNLKEFMECFAGEKWLASQVVSRLMDVHPDNSYGGKSFYLQPLPLLTKSHFQLHIREEKKKDSDRTWTLTIICGGKSDLASQERGLGDADVLRKIVEIINREGK